MKAADRRDSPRWMAKWLLGAGLYNLGWGALTVLAPNFLFDLIGADRPRYPELWQCIGMIVGVYGVGYMIAALDPARHWPIVLVGLLGKVFGPIGFVQAVAAGSFPAAFGWTIITNDLIWWIPFALILKYAYDQHQDRAAHPHVANEERQKVLAQVMLTNGKYLTTHSDPVLLIALRHSGCTFCREALHDFAAAQQAIEAAGWQPVFLHMDNDENFRTMAREIVGNERWQTIADPEQIVYRALNLPRGRLEQLFGWREWLAALVGLIKGYGLGKLRGNGLQLGGMFLLTGTDVQQHFVTERASQRLPFAAWTNTASRFGAQTTGRHGVLI